MLEISRIVTAAGAVAASSGLTIYGVVASHVDPNASQMSLSLWLMVIGLLATVIGLVMFRKSYIEED